MKKLLMVAFMGMMLFFMTVNVSAYEIPDWYYDPDLHYATLGVGNGSYTWVEVEREFTNQTDVSFIFEETTEYIRINMPEIAGGYQSRFEVWFSDGSLQRYNWVDLLGFDDSSETYSVESKRVQFTFDLVNDKIYITGAKETVIEYQTTTDFNTVNKIVSYTYFTEDTVPTADLDFRIYIRTPAIRSNLFVMGNTLSTNSRLTMYATEPVVPDDWIPEGYSFHGWQTIDGTVLIEEDYTGVNDFTDDWLIKTSTGYEMNLFAVFESVTVPGRYVGGYSLISAPGDNVPEWFTNFLTPFRLHTTMGMIILYFVVMIAGLVFMTIKHMNSTIVIVSYSLYNIIWFWFGVLPFYVFMISILLVVLSIVFNIKTKTKEVDQI
ncbi:MAG: hypothetical protein PHS68_05755 [Candidatus Izemoplasmatales bacterium]|nr:hypothetical protein [Candidatus Izemoplasmatales bacterium]